MTKEECNKKVASGERAFSSHDHLVLDKLESKTWQKSFSKFLTVDPLFQKSFPSDLNFSCCGEFINLGTAFVLQARSM